MFQHFILTRFNLRTSQFGASKSRGVSDEWMTKRLQIFKDFCYQSVKHQNNQNFTWLVFFDTQTPHKFVEEISELDKSFSNFVPVYTDGMDNFIPSIREEISKRLTSGYVITSRLDNDDCLHEDYVSAVQAQFNKQDYLAVDMINGVTLQIEGTIQCGYRVHAFNPFISLIESTNDRLDTVWSKRHGGWGKIKRITLVNNPTPLWLSVIHGENILNEYIGFDTVSDKMLVGFHINPKTLADLQARRVSNPRLRSLKLKSIALLRYYLKLIRNKLRASLNLIPEK